MNMNIDRQTDKKTWYASNGTSLLNLLQILRFILLGSDQRGRNISIYIVIYVRLKIPFKFLEELFALRNGKDLFFVMYICLSQLGKWML